MEETVAQNEAHKHGLPSFKHVTFVVDNDTLALDYLLSSETTGANGMSTKVSVAWGHVRFAYKEITSNTIELYSVVDETNPRYELVISEREITIKDLVEQTSITISRTKA